jgi:hypothetical protein
MNEENLYNLKYLLEFLEDMELITLHSYLRTEHGRKMVRVDDIVSSDILDIDFELPTSQLMTYIEMELNQRNLN